MSNLVLYLEKNFQKHWSLQKKERAFGYMKKKFPFIGVSNPQVQSILKEALKIYPLSWNEVRSSIDILYESSEREYHYTAMYLSDLYSCSFEEEDITLLQRMITTHSWWDTVDGIAPRALGKYFQLYPGKIEEIKKKWMAMDHMWLHRSLILFQLKYKLKTDTSLFQEILIHYASDKEFFIRKAIGWSLREYSKVNPSWVIGFIKNHASLFSSLSQREAMKFIEKNRS